MISNKQRTDFENSENYPMQSFYVKFIGPYPNFDKGKKKMMRLWGPEA